MPLQQFSTTPREVRTPRATTAAASRASASDSHHRAHGAVLRYGFAAGCSLVAMMITLVLWHTLFDRNPFALFFAAVMLSAWYGGFGPGLLATGVSVWAVNTFVLPSFASTFQGSVAQAGIFGAVATLISTLNGMRKRALRERDAVIEREKSARREADRARIRAALLADVSNILATALDSPAAVGAVAQRVVPEFADWCAVDFAENDGQRCHRLALAHADAAKLESFSHHLRDYDVREDVSGVSRVIRTSQRELISRAFPESLADLAERDPAMSAFAEAGAVSYMIAPLVAHGRTLGALSLMSCDPGRTYGPQDLSLAEDLAGRLATALDNARLYRDARDANRMKDDFLAVVSHELRTPLNAILGWAQLLHRGGLDEPSVAQGMSAIERNAQSQARIIDDVLDVSRIVQGKLRLELKPLPWRPIVEDAIEAVRPAAAAKKIQLETSLTLSDDRVNGDAERLRQVVWNLLSNAIKFTPKGGHVDVSLTRNETDVAIELRVRDTGIGIAPEFLPHVFERFRQADSSTTRRHGGLGLGLAIVHHLVEVHGGTATAASDGPGKGATFVVRLPAVVAAKGEMRPAVEPRELSKTALSHAHPELKGLRVLLVEDQADARELFVNLLEMCGASVTSATSTQEAVQSFRKRRPDVLLSDIGMAGEDGYALIGQIREIESESAGNVAKKPTPAMAITAFARNEDRKRALRAGYQMHVAKPIGSAEFTAAVVDLVRTEFPVSQTPAPLSGRPLPL
jgi:signal transduction histidine kinase/ActR/RegA family two-component response regulator